jgi:hypothetical protein
MTDNITLPRATVQQVLEAYGSANLDMHLASITALQAALKQKAEPEQQAEPLTEEMRKQMLEASDNYEMRGAFANGWLSAEAAHNIKEGT